MDKVGRGLILSQSRQVRHVQLAVVYVKKRRVLINTRYKVHGE